MTAELKDLITAVLSSVSCPVTIQNKFMQKLLKMSDISLKEMAVSNGDTELIKVIECTCLKTIRRISAVNSDETQDQRTYKAFSNLLLGKIK